MSLEELERRVARPGSGGRALSGSDTLKRTRGSEVSVKYRVVLEHDPESGHYVATVPGLPGLFVDAKSEKEALKLAREGIAFHLEELAKDGKGKNAPKPLPAKVVTVDV